MSHHSQKQFVKSLQEQFPQNFNQIKMLEIGSLNLNGSIREYFTDCTYVGVDVGEGNDVDLVCGGHEVDHPDETYDTIGSCNCFEHNPHWIETFANMYRMTKKTGLVFISVPTTGNAEHGTTASAPGDSPLTIAKGWEYYKNLTEEDFREHFDIDNMFDSYKFQVSDSGDSKDLFFYRFKK
jgi:SAM-dependent methyltransferase